MCVRPSLRPAFAHRYEGGRASALIAAVAAGLLAKALLHVGLTFLALLALLALLPLLTAALALLVLLILLALLTLLALLSLTRLVLLVLLALRALTRLVLLLARLVLLLLLLALALIATLLIAVLSCHVYLHPQVRGTVAAQRLQQSGCPGLPPLHDGT